MKKLLKINRAEFIKIDRSEKRNKVNGATHVLFYGICGCAVNGSEHIELYLIEFFIPFCKIS